MIWKDLFLIYGLHYRLISLELIHLNPYGKGFCFSFQSIMNFTYVVSEPPDMTFGALKPDGSWTGMIGELMNQNTDIGRVF